MPTKMMFDTDSGPQQLIITLNMLNEAMYGIQNVQTVEDLQVIIDRLNKVVKKIKENVQ